MTNLIQAIKQNQDIKSLIYIVRGQEVMLDSDLAMLYGYDVKRLNEQVKRNKNRFPEDFMFQLSNEEIEILRSQIATTNISPMARSLPYVFTEQGIYMLATVLRGKIAEQQSIAIMRAFRELRHFATDNRLLLEKVENIDFRLADHDKKFEEVFNQLAAHRPVSQKIFYDGQIYDAYSLLIDLVQRAEKSVILVDGYVSKITLDILSKKKPKVSVDIHTFHSSKLSETDVKRFNDEYPVLKVYHEDWFHDRFLILDRKDAYLIGASLKDAGKKAFAITKIEDKSAIDEFLVMLGHGEPITSGWTKKMSNE